MTGLAVSGILAACQAGYSDGTRFQYGYSVQKRARNSPFPIPVPRDKPKPPRKRIDNARGKIITARKGKIITARKGNIIIIHKGDTIYALSRRYGVTVRAIIRVNRLRPPYLLHPGQRLKSPAVAIHRVVKADTVYSLSRRYRVDMTTFTRLNGLKWPYILTIGQRLKVPGGLPAPSAHSRKRVLLPPPRSGKGFMWPVRGRILSAFGPKNKGYHNDGINIAARAGSYVRAAESGIVVYTGHKIRGFGNLILIRHRHGWLTAYAHNSAILVRKGQSVKRGRVIARVGQSGGVNRPQLHFELRKGARAVNPVKYLGL
ncbi:MAG: peptidoglycan DD-metalloendopeptidase family protein [Alphaproteobacteria bacterium]|nr:peptidoglycan DD-metalloendopeptidase family protein [Alphaproteobacteria bacterium]